MGVKAEAERPTSELCKLASIALTTRNDSNHFLGLLPESFGQLAAGTGMDGFPVFFTFSAPRFQSTLLTRLTYPASEGG